MFKVYEVTSGCCYSGIALVAANSAEEANKFIHSFKACDTDNMGNSYGHEFVTEDDVIEGLFAEQDGYILDRIYYTG